MISINAQVSLYPLGQRDISIPIDNAIATLQASGLDVQVGTMSTQIWGDDEQVFAALQTAFSQAANGGQAVMVVSISNACPLPPGASAPLAPYGLCDE